MKKEIRPEIREFILNEVNETLARLGVSEKVNETTTFENRFEELKYQFESAPIRQMPMIFKKLIVRGEMFVGNPAECSPSYPWSLKNDIIVVYLDYRYYHFDMGENGCHLGYMTFAVKKDLPTTFESFDGEDGRRYYVRKIEGLSI